MHCISHKTLSSSPSSLCPTMSATEERQPFIFNSLNPNSLIYSKPLLFFLIKVVHILVFASCLTLFHLRSHLSFLFHDILHNYFTFNPLKPFLSCHDLSIFIWLPFSRSLCCFSRWDEPPFLSFVSCFAYSSWKVVIKKGMRIQFAWE